MPFFQICEVRAIPVKVRGKTIWVRPDIAGNCHKAFQFLETVALTHGQLLNYANVGREVGVLPSTVRDYYQILEDTLLGHTLEPWRKRKDRRLT